MKQESQQQRKKYTLNLNPKVADELKQIAALKGVSFSELVNQILINFVKNIKSIHKIKQKGKIKSSDIDDEKYLEYIDSLRKLLSNSGLSKKSKKYLIG